MQPVTPKKSCLASSAASSPTCTSPNSTTATPPSPALYRGVHPTYSPPPKQKKKVRFADPMCKIKSFTTTSYSKEVITEEETPKRGKKRKEIRENVCHTEERPYMPSHHGAVGDDEDCPCNCPSCPYGQYAHHNKKPEKAARHHQSQTRPKAYRPHHQRSKEVLTGESGNPYKPSMVEMTVYFDVADDSSFVPHLQPQSSQPVTSKKRPLQPRPVNTHYNPRSQKYAPPPLSPDYPEANYYPKIQIPNAETCWSFDGSTDMSWPSYYQNTSPSSPQLRRKPAYTKLKALPSATSFRDEYEDYEQAEAPERQLSRQLQRTRPRKSSNSSSSGSSSGSILSAADLERRKWEDDLRMEQQRRRDRERRREKERRLERALEERTHGLGLSYEYYDRPNLYSSDRWDGAMI